MSTAVHAAESNIKVGRLDRPELRVGLTLGRNYSDSGYKSTKGVNKNFVAIFTIFLICEGTCKPLSTRIMLVKVPSPNIVFLKILLTHLKSTIQPSTAQPCHGESQKPGKEII